MEAKPEPPAEGMSLDQLSQAFATMLGQDAAAENPQLPDQKTAEDSEASQPQATVNPRSVIESLLFVGQPDNTALDAEQLAEFISGLAAGEATAHIDSLNAQYKANGCPYEIVFNRGGYRFQLRREFDSLRDRFLGRMRSAKLSPGAVEVLSLVAYHEPLTVDEVSRMRGKPSGAILGQLVRRKLLRLERPDGKKRGKVRYFTTPRFLKLFHLQSLAELPRSDDLQHQ
jgi:segregation and condensation protein B